MLCVPEGLRSRITSGLATIAGNAAAGDGVSSTSPLHGRLQGSCRRN